MILKGVDLSALPDQFNEVKHGRILILDGDGPCYRVAATVKRLDTAIRNFQMEMLKQAFLVKAQHVSIHLTAKDSLKNGRFNVIAVKPYQGQRDSKAKPSLLEPLREAMANPDNWLPEFSVKLHRELEADDGMIIEAYQHKENGVIWSDDKDLRMTPYPYWEKDKGFLLPGESMGRLEPKYTGSGTMKLVGQGPLFFWAQMLMGDTADYIKGILTFNGKLCGPAAAYDALREVRTIQEAANIVFDAYRAIDQNPIPEGYLLWLLRHPQDSVLHYFLECGLSDINKEYLNECYKRVWWGAPS